MALAVIERNEPITNRGESFRFSVEGGYSQMHYSSLGGNCKMCTVSDLGANLDTNAERTLNRLDELFTKCKKLVFQVNLREAKYITILKTRFRMVDLSIIPIGYSRPGQEHHALTYLGTFLTNNEFNSSGVTQDVVLQRMKDKKIKNRITYQKRKYKNN